MPYSTIVAPSSSVISDRTALVNCVTRSLLRLVAKDLQHPDRRRPMRSRCCNLLRLSPGDGVADGRKDALDIETERGDNANAYRGDKRDHHPVLDHRRAILIRQKRTETASELLHRDSPNKMKGVCAPVCR